MPKKKEINLKEPVVITRKEYDDLKAYKEAYEFFHDQAETLDDGCGDETMREYQKLQTVIYTGRTVKETENFWKSLKKKYPHLYVEEGD